MEVLKTTYVVVAVHVYEDGTLEIDLGDDGTPGLWGDTYIREYDGEDVDGEWDFDPEANYAAAAHVQKALGGVR